MYKMAWIKNLEGITEENSCVFVYEVASEIPFYGELCYVENQLEVIRFVFLTTEKDKDNLYHYQLMLRLKNFELSNKHSQKGYAFEKGVIGELLALFSVFLQTRFYLIARHSNIKEGSLGIKFYYDEIDTYKKITHRDFYQMFKRTKKDKRTLKHLNNFLDNIKKLDVKKHLDFILSCDYYLMALKEVGDKGEDEQISYIRLVSSIEVLAQNFKLKNPLEGVLFDDLIISKDKKAVESLKKILNVNRSGKVTTLQPTRKFIEFIKYYSKKGFFIGEKYKETDWTYKYIILKKNLSEHLENIYSARSAYLHSGKPMYLSNDYNVNDFRKIDISIVCGEKIDRKKIMFRSKDSSKVRHLLPYLCWFESLVRYCLLNYVEFNINSKDK